MLGMNVVQFTVTNFKSKKIANVVQVASILNPTIWIIFDFVNANNPMF